MYLIDQRQNLRHGRIPTEKPTKQRIVIFVGKRNALDVE